MLSIQNRGGVRARRAAMVLAAGAVASLASIASGQTWIGATGNWSLGTNWSPTGAPTSGTGTTLSFTGSGAAITATNDIGVFVLNVLNNFTNTSGFTIPATNSLMFDGTTPTINHSGRGTFTIASNVLLNANTTINGSGPGNIALNGVISGPGGLTISTTPPNAFSGYVILGGTNTLLGGVTLNGGNMRIAGAGNLGTGSFTVGASGGVIDVSTGHTPTTTSFNINGATRITGSGGLTISSTNNLTGSGALTLNTTSAMVVQNAATYSGTVTVDRAINPSISGAPSGITLSGASGAMTSVPTWNIRAGGTLTLTNASAAVNSNRIGDTAAINLGSGLISINTNGAAVNEVVGAITGSGYNVIGLTASTGTLPVQISASSLARADRGTFLIRGSSLGTGASIGGLNGYFTLGSAPTLVGGGGPDGSTTISILPWAVGDTSGAGNGTSFVTYNNTTGFRPLAVAEYAANLTSGATTNARLTAATANAGSQTVNALALVGGSVTGAGSLTISSGAIFNSGSTGAIANTIVFPSGVEGVITTNTTMGISGNMTGDNGVTISSSTAAGSATTLTLSGNNTGLTGTLTLNAGTIAFANLNNLPGTGQIVTSGRGSGSTVLSYTSTTPINISRDIAVNNGWLSLNTSSTLGGDVTYSGVISGNGALFTGSSSGNSRIILTGNNTYTGSTRINEGQVVISSDANLGNGGGVDFFSGASAMGTTTVEGIAMTGNWTTSRNINFSSSGGVDTGAFNAVWNGPLTGSSGLTKVGSGELRINSNNPYSGPVLLGLTSPVLAGGDFRLANDGGLMSTSYTSNVNSRIILDNSTVPTGTPSGSVTIDRVVDNATVTLASGGRLTVVGNAAQSVREVIGTLTVSGPGNILRNESSGGQTSTLQIGNLSLGSNSLLVQGTNLGGLSGSLGRIFLTQFNGAAATNGQILTNLTAEDLSNPGVIEQGVYDTTVGIRLLDPITDFTNGVAIQNGAPTNLPTTANFRVNPGVVNPVPVLDAANTINALRFAPNGNVDYTDAANSVLTITSGSLFTEAGGAAAITQGGAGTLTLTSGATQMGIVTNSNLTVAAGIGGTGGFSKTGAATLTLNGPITNTGAVGITSGTVVLGAGVNLTVSSLSGAGALDFGANNLSLTAASNVNTTLIGTGPLSIAGATTLSGNNVAFSGPVNGGAAATVTLGNNNGFGTGQVTLANPNSTSLITFNGGDGTVSNNIAFAATTATAGITHNSSLSNQSVTLSGLLTGGSATQLLRLANGNANDSCTTVLTNPGNTFAASSIQVWEGVLAFTSDGALGNAANGLSLNTTSTTRGGIRFDANNITLGAGRGVSVVDANFIDTQANTGTIAGVISNVGAITKTGVGTLIFSNTANTHTGIVNVNAGTLQVDGNIALSTTNPVNVKTGATLSGTGSILRTVNVEAGGLLAPGSSPGIIDVNGLSMVANSTLFIEIDGNAAGDGANFHDQVNVTGTVSLGSATLDLDSLTNYFPAITDLLFIIANDGADAVTGTFAGLSEGAVVTWDTYWSANISYLGDTTTGTIGNGNDVVLYNVVPAPGAGVLFGLAGVFASRRRRR